MKDVYDYCGWGGIRGLVVKLRGGGKGIGQGGSVVIGETGWL